MSLLIVLESVRRLRNDPRVAATTMRAVPDWSSGTLRLPSGRETRMRFGSTCVTLADCTPSSENRGKVRPFCSSVMVKVARRARGASATTSSVPAWPTTRSGLSMRRTGGVSRPATKYAAPSATSARRTSPASQRMDSIIQSLVNSRFPTNERRYRLGVRTRGSQPRDRGSNPRTATRLVVRPTRPACIAPKAHQGDCAVVVAALLSAIHMLTLALGVGGVFARGLALSRPLDDAGWKRLLAADTVWGVAAVLWIASG